MGATVIAAGVVAAPSVGAFPNATPRYEPSPVEWTQCTNQDLIDAGAECAKVKVPLDYSNPGGEKIDIAISRVKHTSSSDAYQGVVLGNPGGPGGSGLDMSLIGSRIPSGVGAYYDWIGFDPRGVGDSGPTLSCGPDQGIKYDQPDLVPRSDITEQALKDKASGHADACGKNSGELLKHIKTTDAAEDMESIRLALGVEQINYFGYSYGTYLGPVYSTMFPGKVKRMILDGNVDPQTAWYRSNHDQAKAAGRTLGKFFEWIAKYDRVYHLGATGTEVETRWFGERDRLDRAAAGGRIGSVEWTELFYSAVPGQGEWDRIATAFSGWVNNGQWEALQKLYDETQAPKTSGDVVLEAVLCTDAPYPDDWAQWSADAWKGHAQEPFYAWPSTWGALPCNYWTAGALEKPVQVDGENAPPTLLIHEQFDGATPYEDGLALRKLLTKSSLIGLPGGTTHSNSLSGNTCVDNAIASFFADITTLPTRKPGDQADMECEPASQPVPKALGGPRSGLKMSQRPAGLENTLKAPFRTR
ncbi:alpha/beta fold hydrolase [Herbihabitans rhizosphaerae]|uniref:alpha/beta fold hydrolase n=1 Tax=Herbihabitans rhizosphaerae TaxID=1872711 RepID=UPI001F5FDDE9|nr:alpha/beta fold hydrolase [Herbihabitans rhizosphaerae]